MHRTAAVAAALAGLVLPSTALAVQAPLDPTHNGRGYVRSERAISRTSVPKLGRDWQADLAANSPGSALIAADRVIVPGSGTKPGLQALDLVTGKPLWSWASGVNDAGAPVRSQTRFIAAGSGTVTALDRDTGKPEWTRDLAGGGETVVAAGFNRVFVATDRSLTTLAAETGRVRWAEAVDARQRLAVNSGWLFTTQPGMIASRRPADGAARWKYELGRGKTTPSTPFVSRSVAYVAAPDAAGGIAVSALDSVKGVSLWETRVGDDVCGRGCDLATPVADDHAVYVMTPDGRIVALDRLTGKERWTLKLGTRTIGDHVVSAGGVLFAATEKRGLVAVGIAAGDVLWEQLLSAEPAAGPVLGAGSVVARSRDGRTVTYAIPR